MPADLRERRRAPGAPGGDPIQPPGLQAAAAPPGPRAGQGSGEEDLHEH